VRSCTTGPRSARDPAPGPGSRDRAATHGHPNALAGGATPGLSVRTCPRRTRGRQGSTLALRGSRTMASAALACPSAGRPIAPYPAAPGSIPRRPARTSRSGGRGRGSVSLLLCGSRSGSNRGERLRSERPHSSRSWCQLSAEGHGRCGQVLGTGGRRFKSGRPHHRRKREASPPRSWVRFSLSWRGASVGRTQDHADIAATRR
jgi:hypothetical protein